MKILCVSICILAFGWCSDNANAQAVWVNPAFSSSSQNYSDTVQIDQQNKPTPETIKTQKNLTENSETTEISKAETTGTKWSGRFNFGASLQTGNTEEEQITTDISVKAKFNEKNRAQFKADYFREKNNDTVTEDNRSLDLLYDYIFAEKWFLESNLGLEQDDIENLDLRTIIGAGLGYQPYDEDNLKLEFVLGPSFLREEFETRTNSSLTARFATDYEQKILEERFDLFHNHELFIPVDDTAAFLFQSNTGVRIPIYKGLIGTGEINFDWDNDPVPGVVEDDTTYALKLGYEWGGK